MKRIGLIILSTALIFLWTGCQTAGKAALRTQKDPIALVSIASNWDIPWKGEDAIDPRTISPLAQRTLRLEPDKAIISNAEELINNAEGILRDTLTDGAKLNLADKQTVLNSQAYRNAAINRFQVNAKMVKPTDYQFIDYRDKNFPAALAAETGIQRSMFVEFSLNKVMATGAGKFGSCRADVGMTIQILDAQGKNLYKVTIALQSRDTTKVMNGLYSQNDLMNLFESAITDAGYEFLDGLEK